MGSNPLIRDAAPSYREILTHATPDEYWPPLSATSGYQHITAPVLNISGWYDILLWSTLQNYRGMRQRGGSERARTHQRLIIGPWTHADFSGSFPDREFGLAASTAAIDLPGIQLRWFDHWLRDHDDGVDREPPVMIFIMGIDQWRTETDWPLPDTQYRPYYLHSGGQANSFHGDGTRSTTPPDDEPSDVYLCNPVRPVPSVGGQVLLPGATATGPRDQREVEARDDVLIYTSPVLDQPVEVTGDVELRLWASSSAPDTDFTGNLVDVHPDGRDIILTDGIPRARYRNSLTHPEPMRSGTPYELTLNLWATANVFLPGHRIRLEVASVNFPKFDRNSNTGGDITSETSDQYQPAINGVHHDSEPPGAPDPAHHRTLRHPVGRRPGAPVPMRRALFVARRCESPSTDIRATAVHPASAGPETGRCLRLGRRRWGNLWRPTRRTGTRVRTATRTDLVPDVRRNGSWPSVQQPVLTSTVTRLAGDVPGSAARGRLRSGRVKGSMSGVRADSVTHLSE